MRCFLPDEEKLKIKISNLPIIKHEKVELCNRLSFEEARKYFRYKDGKIYWLKPPYKNRKIGSEAGGLKIYKEKYQNHNTYRIITLKGKQYLTGQIIFLLVHGYLPKYLFFKDGNTLNTKIDNLTASSYSMRVYRNLKNRKTTLNLKGVTYDRNKYKASIQVNKKTYHLGLYQNLEMAKKAYNLAVKKLYGELAYLNN
jgi:hypothetical protein